MGYREDGLATYGDKCEICTYAITEVHHIDYQEHQEVEDYLRYLSKHGNNITNLVKEAKEQGYLYWDGHQLSKDDRSTNLAVLCSNCHSLIHRMDVGKKLLKVLNKRR
jgi:hypothetical protein